MSGVRFFSIVALLSLPSTSQAVVVVPTDFVEEGIVTGLDEPNSLAFLPDGRLLLTERTTGKVRMVVAGHLAATDPALTVPDVRSDDAERGCQGIAVDPRWPQHPYIYVGLTRTDGLALMRFTGSGDLSDPLGENLTFGSPYALLQQVRDLCPCHNGLGLRFGTDGHLLFTIGDDGAACQAQDTTSLVGKLLRLDVSRLPAGAGGPPPVALLIPPGNPFAGIDSVAALVYAYGLRNPWRFHVDPATGAILLADVGLSEYEEIDEVFGGDNFGWPFREGPLIRTPPDCSEPGGAGATTYDPPIIAVHQSEGFSAILTAGIYRPPLGATATWPSTYWGNLFFGNFYYSQLRRLIRSGGDWLLAPTVPGQPTPLDWATEIVYVSDFLEGPDGSLYWLKAWDDAFNPISGMVRRIRYTGPPVGVAPRSAPVATLAAAPNPFHGATVLNWSAPHPGPLHLEIFDLAGRRVRDLGQSVPVSGGRATWDGRDDHGDALPAGVYLARARHRDLRVVVRLLRLD